jgi:hypothetical protein
MIEKLTMESAGKTFEELTGERGGARVGAQMAEDFVDHRRIFDPCPEPVEGAAMIFKLRPQFGQCSMSMSKTRLSSRAQLMRGVSPWAAACGHGVYYWL